MSTLKDACEKHGMEINTKKNKTEVMVISKEPEKGSIYLNEEKINQTETFTYLGTLITEDGKFKKNKQYNSPVKNCLQYFEKHPDKQKSSFQN